jgi:hypothetical protein
VFDWVVLVARMKVKGARRQNGRLKLSAPDDLKLKVLAENGMVIPGRLDDGEVEIPLDLTSLTGRDVGRQFSYWSIRHSHAIVQVAIHKERQARLAYDKKIAEAKWMNLYSANFRTVKDAQSAMLEDKEIRGLAFRLMKAETAADLLEAVSRSYEVLMKACSREMSRRLGQRPELD